MGGVSDFLDAASYVLFHNQDKLVSVLNATQEQTVQNHGDILTLASNLSSLTDKANLLA